MSVTMTRLCFRCAKQIALSTLLGFVAGCSGRHAVSVDLSSHMSSQVLVAGDAPFVIVTNRGPGVITATFDAGTAAATPRQVEPGSSTGRSLLVSNTVTIATGDRAASAEIEGLQSDGVSVVQPAAP